MDDMTVSRRSFLAIATSAMAAQAMPAFATPPEARPGAEVFVNRWDEAWNRHDPEALGALHTDDTVTVNRFGTIVEGRAAVIRALAFLHAPDGPFARTQFPAQRILSVRRIAPGVISVQTAWKSPVMHSDGKIGGETWNEMIVSFVLVQRGQEWKATDVDLHNVEKMDLPFSNPIQKG